ncbi:hypothetical protein DdX_04808 [Ditylenchus destructor]|uniref:Uncharacterized protein n=1 Tax=Ditylenchus destructor TaxID=166010 RepID=A0AAD4ND45_9BILA|nr:hypothetical protein DdX_04808 [Ditylenchus destructor]
MEGGFLTEACAFGCHIVVTIGDRLLCLLFGMDNFRIRGCTFDGDDAVLRLPELYMFNERNVCSGLGPSSQVEFCREI